MLQHATLLRLGAGAALLLGMGNFGKESGLQESNRQACGARGKRFRAREEVAGWRSLRWRGESWESPRKLMGPTLKSEISKEAAAARTDFGIGSEK